MKLQKNNRRLLIILPISTIAFVFYLLFFEFILNQSLMPIFNEKNYHLLDVIENKSLDFLTRIRSKLLVISSFLFYSNHQQPIKVSPDIMIITNNEKSRKRIEYPPFHRIYYAGLVEYFNQIKNPENTLFLNDYFSIPDLQFPETDLVLINAINKNSKIVFGYPALDKRYIDNDLEQDMENRLQYLNTHFDKLLHISGPFDQVNEFLNILPPLKPYMEKIAELGYVKAYEDSDGIVRRQPLITRFIKRDQRRFVDLRVDEYADTVLISRYVIRFDQSIRQYELKRAELNSSRNDRLYDQTALPLVNRKPLTQIDLDSIKFKIEKLENNFTIELDNLRGKIINDRKHYIKKILKYVKASNIPAEIKQQLIDIFTPEEDIKDFDEIMINLVDSLKEFTKRDKNWQKQVDYFQRIADRCLKVDRNKLMSTIKIDGEYITLYDLLFNDKKLHLSDKLVLNHENYLLSASLVLLCRYYHVNFSDIRIILGKYIILKNPLMTNNTGSELVKPIYNGKSVNEIRIPIDCSGNLLISYNVKSISPLNSRLENFDTYKYDDFLIDDPVFADNKIVLIDKFTDDTTENRWYQTPFDLMDDTDIIANTINTVFMNDYIKILPRYIYQIILLMFTLLISLILVRQNKINAYISIVIFGLCYYLFVIFAFVIGHVFFEMFKVICLMPLVLVSDRFCRHFFLKNRNF